MNNNRAFIREGELSLEILFYNRLAEHFAVDKRIRYSEGRQIAGRIFHLRKNQARMLILQMRKQGLITTGNRGFQLLPINYEEAEL